jgi:hypothetical protein
MRPRQKHPVGAPLELEVVLETFPVVLELRRRHERTERHGDSSFADGVTNRGVSGEAFDDTKPATGQARRPRSPVPYDPLPVKAATVEQEQRLCRPGCGKAGAGTRTPDLLITNAGKRITGTNTVQEMPMISGAAARDAVRTGRRNGGAAGDVHQCDDLVDRTLTVTVSVAGASTATG